MPLADSLAVLASRVRRLYDNPRRPEHFHEEKDEIARELVALSHSPAVRGR